MAGDEFFGRTFDEKTAAVEKRTTRLLVLILAAGFLGIGVSVSAIYFLSSDKAGSIAEKLRGTVGSVVELRETPRLNFHSPRLNFHSPRLSRRENSTSNPNTSDNSTVVNSQSPQPASQSPAASPIGRFGKILISEIQIEGASTGDEFIELYNPNDFIVSLDGWSVKKKTLSGNESTLIPAAILKGKTIAPKSYFLAARTEAEIPTTPDVWWAKSNTISANNTILLYGKLEKEEILVDAVGFGDAYEFETAPAPNPGKGETLARKSPNDTDNNAADFIRAIPSPKNAAFKAGFITPQAAPSPSPTQTPIPSPSPTLNPSQTPSPSPSPSPAPTISPRISSDSTPSPTSSPSPLPSPSPSPSPTPSPSPEPTPTPSASARVIISEILFNPAGSDTGKEFIELFNPGGSDIDLRGWSLRLQDIGATSSTSLVTFGSKEEDITLIPSGKYLLVGMNSYNALPAPDVERSASLPNSSRTILLINRNGEIIDAVTYDGTIPEGSSWERISPDGEEFQAQPSPSPRNSTE
jgi:hypothetical protein